MLIQVFEFFYMSSRTEYTWMPRAEVLSFFSRQNEIKSCHTPGRCFYWLLRCYHWREERQELWGCTHTFTRGTATPLKKDQINKEPEHKCRNTLFPAEVSLLNSFTKIYPVYCFISHCCTFLCLDSTILQLLAENVIYSIHLTPFF